MNALSLRFTYNPETGIFYRGTKQAGYVDKKTGYTKIMFQNKNYFAHRLAFLYMTGNFPEGHVDHINHNRSDNAWSNLRDVPQEVNNQNTAKAKVSNKLQVLGVRQRGNSYTASLGIDKKHIHLGTFSSSEEAHEAYIKAKRDLHVGCTL